MCPSLSCIQHFCFPGSKLLFLDSLLSCAQLVVLLFKGMLFLNMIAANYYCCWRNMNCLHYTLFQLHGELYTLSKLSRSVQHQLRTLLGKNFGFKTNGKERLLSIAQVDLKTIIVVQTAELREQLRLSQSRAVCVYLYIDMGLNTQICKHTLACFSPPFSRKGLT